MWNTESLWFEIALISSIFALGNIFFGHFEERTPKWRKVLKFALFVLIAIGISTLFGRIWTFAFLGVLSLLVLYVHGVVLPRKGINGWTAEPKDKYYAMRGWKD